MIRLAGCRSDSLLGYLKALGVLRLIATQVDAHARGSWDGATFVLDTALSQDEVESSFVASYRPTPVMNPWNSGAGFDGKLDNAAETLRRVSQTQSERWGAYRRVLSFITKRSIETGRRSSFLAAADKRGYIREIRATCPDELLPWLDAALVLTADGLGFPYLLGSGGNDGRLDFSVNFMARALDVCGDKPIDDAAALLRDSLYESSQGRLLSDVAIGQFSPRHAGGANETCGFNADSLVNPWDYVLMIEGVLLFSGSIGRRTDRTPGRAVFPFALRPVAGGYGSASKEEQAGGTRGEMWLPVWDGLASFASVTDLLRKGRIDLPSDGERSVVRSAVLATEAAAAIATLGVPLGLRRLERIGFVQRNGLAYAATAIGTLDVHGTYDRGIAIISRDVASWIERIRRMELGAAARDAQRSFDERLLAFASLPPEPTLRARARQDLLVTITDLDRAVGRLHRSDIPGAPQLNAEIAQTLDDYTPLHRCALAIASLGSHRYDTQTLRELRLSSDDPIGTLRNLLDKRTREDAKEPDRGCLRPSCTVSAADVAAFLAFDQRERRRFNQLLRAYALINLRGAKPPRESDEGRAAIPIAYAVLKLVFDNRKARDERILRLLFAGRSTDALALATRRAHTIRYLPEEHRVRHVSSVDLDDAPWTAAGLLLPLESSIRGYRALLNGALTCRSGMSDAAIGNYVATIA